MDIEGAEKEALLGAEKIIKEQKPKLAISIYHKKEDIWEISSLILKMNFVCHLVRWEMLNLCNDVSSIYELLQTKKQLVIYGAGASTKLLLEAYYDKGLKDNLVFIVDRNEHLDGTKLIIRGDVGVNIISLKTFCIEYAGRMKDFTLLITPYTALRIVTALDGIDELNGVDTYIYSLIVNKEEPNSFCLRNADSALIPKKIHYFWIGGNPLPEEYQRNIESWRKYAPDYEIIEWNETNYDFAANRYTYEALKSKQYMYATDYARKDILYEYGGIYLDTDVELVAPMDDLLYNEVFVGIDDGGQLIPVPVWARLKTIL